MKEFWKEIRTAIFMGFLLPAMLLWFGTALLDMQQEEEIVQPAQPQSAAEGTKVPVRTGEEVEDQLLEEYLVNFGGSRNAMFRMKEHWGLLLSHFRTDEKLAKKLRKTTDLDEYRTITHQILESIEF